MNFLKRSLYSFFLSFFYKEMQLQATNPVLMRKQDLLARIYSCLLMSKFGLKTNYVVFGDSNSENLRSAKNQKVFDDALGFGVNLGIGGSTPMDWIEFFYSDEGKQAYSFMSSLDYQILNIGGNCVIQDKMRDAETSLITLKKLFPKSFNCLLPPLRYALLEDNPVDEVKQKVEKINEYISTIWGEQTIDTHLPFIDNYTNNGEPYFWVLDDAVHFSENADNNVRIPIIISKIKSLG